MDAALTTTIARLVSWAEIRQFEENARTRSRLDDSVRDALNRRRQQLARAQIEEQTGLMFSALSPAEEKVVEVVSEYVALKAAQGSHASRTLRQLAARGLLGAAEASVSRATPTDGFTTLQDADQSELLYERIVLDHPEEFSPRAAWYARRALGLPNVTERAPAAESGSTQSRTQELIAWLRNRSRLYGGRLGVFNNQQVAEAMGIGDMGKYGRVHGNIQSRLDFACYRLNFPPLGLAASAPFENAWGAEQREWIFPIARMQAAAQSRHWTDADFDALLDLTRRLSGRAVNIWREELRTKEAEVMAWALSLAEPERPLSYREAVPTLTRPRETGSPERDVSIAEEGNGEDANASTAGVPNSATREDGEADLAASTQRNERWSRDELILALDLYVRHRDAPLQKGAAEIAELSSFLNRLAQVLNVQSSSTFRNVNGVYMKLMNFRRFDPSFASTGAVGLRRGNKDEELVWAEFAHDQGRLDQAAKFIRTSLDEHGQSAALSGPDDPNLVEAEEGRVATRQHTYRERDRSLVVLAKQAAMQRTGRLCCAACGFDFSKRYGTAGENIIDVHHTKPIHTMQPGEKTRVSDLALLCSNCHRIVHSRRRWLTVEQVQQLLQPQDPVV